MVGYSALQLFDKVEREKRNAGGGVLAVRVPCSHGARMLRDFRPNPAFRSIDSLMRGESRAFGETLGPVLGRLSTQRPLKVHSFRIYSRIQLIKPESLILAQNERWRQA